jgi:hypothetical protein
LIATSSARKRTKTLSIRQVFAIFAAAYQKAEANLNEICLSEKCFKLSGIRGLSFCDKFRLPNTLRHMRYSDIRTLSLHRKPSIHVFTRENLRIRT